jgi:hypothetical protein
VVNQHKNAVIRSKKRFEADLRERLHHVFLSMNYRNLDLTGTSPRRKISSRLEQKAFRHARRRLSRSFT